MFPISPTSPEPFEPIHRRLRELGAKPPQRNGAGPLLRRSRRPPKPQPPDPEGADQATIDRVLNKTEDRANLTGADLNADILTISHAFYHMEPALAVDLFSLHRRETSQDVVSLGSRFWLESTFKQQVVRFNWAALAADQLNELLDLVAYMNGQTTSSSIVKVLRNTEWFQQTVVPVFGDVANDMFHLYFCREHQVRWNAETKKAWEEQEVLYKRATRVNKLVPVLQHGDPGYDSADYDSSTGSDSDGQDGDAMDIDGMKPSNRAFG